MATPTTPVHKGVGVHWGVSSTGCTGFGTFALQSRDLSKRADSEVIQDATGFATNKTFFNHTDSATLEVVFTGSSGGNLTPTIAEIGDTLTITDSVFTQIAGTTWIVEDVSVRSSNTTAMRATVNLTKYPKI